ncbi:hypothetical protein [Ravibacter arvi]
MLPFQNALAGFCSLVTLILIATSFSESKPPDLKIAYFETDATPPIGSPVAYAPARSITDSLSARGVVLTGIGKPIVLATVDWITIANEGLTKFSQKLAQAAGTTADRVSIHVLHQHDTPRCDISTEKLLEKHGLGGKHHDMKYLNRVMDQASLAVSSAMKRLQPVTHIGIGKAKVDKVASNRRILGPDGKVAIVRFSSATDPKAIAAPEGLIDPWLRSVSFWSGDKAVVALSYYATHPQSYYGKGDVTAEFIGMARKAREATTGVPQVFFIGAAGNVAAGKYNDGSQAMRAVLAERIEKAMTASWAATEKREVSPQNNWSSQLVQLPPAAHMKVDSLQNILNDTGSPAASRFGAARKLAWLEQQKKGAGIRVSSLRLGGVRLLHLPSELFVEYQLNAQKLCPEEEVCTAGYGEGGQGYIGTQIAYTQGGYEVEPRVSMVAPASEKVLMSAIQKVLK